MDGWAWRHGDGLVHYTLLITNNRSMADQRFGNDDDQLQAVFKICNVCGLFEERNINTFNYIPFWHVKRHFVHTTVWLTLCVSPFSFVNQTGTFIFSSFFSPIPTNHTCHHTPLSVVWYDLYHLCIPQFEFSHLTSLFSLSFPTQILGTLLICPVNTLLDTRRIEEYQLLFNFINSSLSFSFN